ncbi:L-rhamnose isomerase, partial [Zavarzinia sp.]|uniref:L-rhamnose isomerase n=1 Tax=Zavarzinia sp. TaxID=2027920 RepID=UPI003567D6D0
SYGEWGVDARAALRALAAIPISLHCWQGDDVAGFEAPDAALTGGIQATGAYPGKARTPEELRSDLSAAMKLIPGPLRLNLHASYAETGGRRVERSDLLPEHFSAWMDWARAKRMGLDFNPTFFSHPLSADGFSLSHKDAGVRRFWIEHGRACRRIGAAFGRTLGTACVTNVWIHDGFKDIPIERAAYRERLKDSLDQVFAEPIDARHNLDAIEGKLFGIGSESCVIGSHEFYLAYALANKKLLTLDSGHYHPTESMADKISAVLQFLDAILLHVSRAVRWDSDHVVILNDELRAIAEELVRGAYLERVHIGLDFFDASINRIAAWVIGARCMRKALLAALLEPAGRLRAAEQAGDFTARLAWLEEAKTLPLGAVWDYYCLQAGVPTGGEWLAEVKKYEADITAKRN